MCKANVAESQAERKADDVLIGMQLGNAILHAVNGGRTVKAGLTVGDFIDALHQLGVRLTDPLSSIEFGVSRFGSGQLVAERDEHGGVEVREVR